MTEHGDRTVSALYITEHTRPWSMTLDSLSNQGMLDTSAPSHAVDLDAIRRACDGTTRPNVRHLPPPPRVIRPRRRRAWSGWEVLAFFGIVALIVALVADPLRTVVNLAAAAVLALPITMIVIAWKRLQAVQFPEDVP